MIFGSRTESGLLVRFDTIGFSHTCSVLVAHQRGRVGQRAVALGDHYRRVLVMRMPQPRKLQTLYRLTGIIDAINTRLNGILGAGMFGAFGLAKFALTLIHPYVS